MFKHITFITLCAVLCACSSVSKEKKSNMNSVEALRVEGITEYNENNINESREGAVYDAKLKALRIVADLFASDYRSDPAKYDVFQNLVTEDPDRFIRKFRIISEGEHGNTYKSDVEVMIYTSKVAAAVKNAGLVSSVQGPKAALFVYDTPKNGDFEQYLVQALSKDSVMNVVVLKPEDAGTGTYEELNAAAAKVDAEMYIKATADAKFFGGAMNTGFYPYSADGHLEVVEVPSGKRFCDISRQGSSNESSKDASLKKSMLALAEKLSKDAAVRVDPQLKTPPVVSLYFENLQGFEAVDTMKNYLSGLNFKHLSLESFNGGVAMFNVVPSTNDNQELASIVLRMDSMGLQISGITGKEIRFFRAY